MLEEVLSRRVVDEMAPACKNDEVEVRERMECSMRMA